MSDFFRDGNTRDYQHLKIHNEVKLSGGFYASLSRHEMNQFQEFVRASDEYLVLNAANDSKNAMWIAIGGGPLRDSRPDEVRRMWAVAEECVRVAEAAMYDLAKRWYADLCAKDGAKGASET